ncbi:MAG: chemotaxis protein CheW [Candidatus Eremiobacteraeota bacterium]|nr:chemotaxis protein CheW [Candidatus Eremiobacteraeota bacterium]MCW5869762.1 chemotaxis protein CheW [Candidatus Eremiobacteraeota bacterium]
MSEGLEIQRFLLCRLATSWCALGLQGLGEVMRPQPVERVAGLPEFVDGLAVIRGEALPVVNLPRLLCGSRSPEGTQERFVTAHSQGRQLALRVDEVAGIFPLKSEIWHALPSLLDGLQGDHLAALGSLDGDLVMLLRRTNLLSEADWEVLNS